MSSHPQRLYSPRLCRPVALTLSFLLLVALAPAPAPTAIARQGTNVRPLRIGEQNIILVGQSVPIVLGSIIDPATRRELPAAQVVFTSSAPTVVRIEGRNMVALRASSTPVRISVKTRATRRAKSRTVLVYEVEVREPNPVRGIVFTPDGPTVSPGEMITVTAIPLDANNNHLPPTNRLKLSLVDPDHQNYVQAFYHGNQVSLYGKRDEGALGPNRPTRLLISASSGDQVSNTAVVQLGPAPKPAEAPKLPKTHSLQGQVLSSGGGVGGVAVKLRKEGSPVSSLYVTNEKGEYEFKGQEPGGPYFVEAEKDGYTFNSTTTQPVSLTENKSVNFAAAAVPTPEPIIKFVDAKAEQVDYRTASSLYGNVTNKQYYVVRVQLFNKLADLKNGNFVGDSIVVSSDSVKIPVNYEIRYAGKRKDVDASRRQWHPLEQASQTALEHKGMYLERALVPWKQRQFEKGMDMNCTQTPDYRRPYTYDQMTGTVDRRDSRELRTRVLAAAQSASTLTSFFTSFIIPVNTNDVPTILDKFNNLLVPSYKEIFPSTKNEHRQNLARDTMRPLETIPFKQDVNKSVFLPKLHWAANDFEVRISHICEEPFPIEAIVAKEGDKLPIHNLTGKVTDEDGNPVANATVELSGLFIAPEERTTTRSGTYSFSNLGPGKYTLTVLDSKGCKLSDAEDVELPEDRKKDVTLPAIYEVSGKVKKADSSPVAGAQLVLTKGSQSSAPVVTDAEGKFTFRCVTKGDYQLAVSGQTMVTKTVDVTGVKSNTTVPDIVVAPIATPSVNANTSTNTNTSNTNASNTNASNTNTGNSNASNTNAGNTNAGNSNNSNTSNTNNSNAGPNSNTGAITNGNTNGNINPDPNPNSPLRLSQKRRERLRRLAGGG